MGDKSEDRLESVVLSNGCWSCSSVWCGRVFLVQLLCGNWGLTVCAFSSWMNALPEVSSAVCFGFLSRCVLWFAGLWSHAVIGRAGQQQLLLWSIHVMLPRLCNQQPGVTQSAHADHSLRPDSFPFSMFFCTYQTCAWLKSFLTRSSVETTLAAVFMQTYVCGFTRCFSRQSVEQLERLVFAFFHFTLFLYCQRVKSKLDQICLHFFF